MAPRTEPRAAPAPRGARPRAGVARAWPAALLVASGTLSGCYATHSTTVTERDAGARDAGPWDGGGRVERDAGETACACPCLDDAHACGPAPETVVPVHEGPGGNTWHWRRDRGCIAIRYTPDLEPYADTLRAAVSAWLDLPCSALCYEPPVAAEPGARDCAHAIHFIPEDFSSEAWGTCGSAGTAGLIAATPTLAIQQATPCVPLDGSPGLILSAVGYALGLLQVRDASADSVMRLHPDDRERTTLGADDVASYCAMYGEAPHCPY